MKQIRPSWDHYEAFFVVLSLGSLSAAARKLGVRQSTVGRQIEALERELGVTLFTRSQRGLRPTDTAHRLRPHLEALANASEALVRDAQVEDAGLSGTVRVTAGESVGFVILPKVLKELSQKLPNIKIEISISDKIEDLLLREADIAIRSGLLDQKALIAKNVGRIEMGLFATKDYLRGKTIPKSDDELIEHPLIGFEAKSERTRRAARQIPFLMRDDFLYSSDSINMHSCLVDAGCGIGLCPVEQDQSKRVRILPELYKAQYPLCVAMHEDLKKIPKFRSVFKELVSSLKVHLSS